MDDSGSIYLAIDHGVAVITCIGDIDVNNATELRQLIGTATRSGASRLIVDLSQASLVDSTTLGVLLHASTACKDADMALVVAGAVRIVARSISLTGLDRVLTLAPDLPAAHSLAAAADSAG